MRVALALSLCFAIAPAVAAQMSKSSSEGDTVRIEALSIGLKATDAGKVLRISRLGGAVVNVTVPMTEGTLQVGDQIVSVADGLKMSINCRGAKANFYDKFVVFIEPPDQVKCAVKVEGGSVDFRSNEKTRATSDIAGVVAGSESTEYGIRTGQAGNVAKVLVFEGAVRILRPKQKFFHRFLFEGKLLDVNQGTRSEIPNEEIQGAASVAAELDVAKAVARGIDVGDVKATFENLQREHAAVLRKPHDAEVRKLLAQSQATLGLEEEAAYNSQPRLARSDGLSEDQQRKLNSYVGNSVANCSEAILEWEQGDRAGAREFAKRAMEKNRTDHALSGEQLERCQSIAGSD